MLAFEQRVPPTLPSPEELRAMHPDEVRGLLDLEPNNNLEAAILEFEAWRTRDNFEDFDVENDIYLVVHPNAIQDAIIVEPEFDKEDFDSYPYQEMIELFEDRAKKDEILDLEQIPGTTFSLPVENRYFTCSVSSVRTPESAVRMISSLTSSSPYSIQALRIFLPIRFKISTSTVPA